MQIDKNTTSSGVRVHDTSDVGALGTINYLLSELSETTVAVSEVNTILLKSKYLDLGVSAYMYLYCNSYHLFL